MFIKSFCIALGAVMLAVVPITGAFAANDPIPGIDIIVKKKPPRGIVVQTTTDARGEFTLKELAPGTYTIELGGKSLVAATAKTGSTTRTSPAAAAPGGRATVVPGDVTGDGEPIIAVLVALLLPAPQARGGAAPAALAPQTFHGKATARGMQIELVVPDGPARAYKGTITR